MGLDIYVGSLTRYYCRDWESAVQRLGRDMGIAVKVIAPSRDHAPPPTADEARSIISPWMQKLRQSAAKSGITVREWDEHTNDYFTDKPAWDCYDALRLWAARDEHPAGFLSRLRPARGIDADPSLKKSVALASNGRYHQIVSGAEFWLPIEQNVVFNSVDPTMNPTRFGSTICLQQQLRLLNERTWRSNAMAATSGEREPTSMADKARSAWQILTSLVDQACAYSLPMKLDY